MAENVLPGANGTNADATRGIAYYEKLKRDLGDTLPRKRAMDKNMAQLEEQIFRLEGQYLEETAAGNIIKGFDNYVKGSIGAGGASGGGGGGTSTRRKGGIVEQDRVFSRSSASFMRESSPQSSAQTTPSHAPTPTSVHGPSAPKDVNPTPTGAAHKAAPNSKKKKAPDKDEDELEGKPTKRLKITYARGEKGAD